jgi:hypothetical protein
MSEPNRQSDSALCRRIAKARGWTDFAFDRQNLCGVPPGADVCELYVVPRPDVDADACLELMTYLCSKRWHIARAGYIYSVDGHWGVLLRFAAYGTTAKGSGETLEQAFARAAADALEAMQK